MAKDVKSKDPKKELEAEAIDRLRDARRWKELWVIDFRECYFFSAPHRQRQVSSQTKPPVQRLLDAPELQTSCGYEWTGDFVTEVVNTYMPEAQNWCERGPGMFISPDMFKQVQDQVRKQDKQIFEAMKASNLYPEIAKAFNPDLAIGTVGLWIDMRRPHLPIEVMACPLRELEVNIGPGGLIDDRFVIRYTKYRYLKSLLPKDVSLPKKIEDQIRDVPNNSTDIKWGFWRLWEEDEETWQHTIQVEDDLVHDARMVGEGSCPLIVGRWNATSDWPWGYGPLIQTLPDLRQIDELEGRKIDVIDRNLDPPLGYPDDSFTHVEQGVENGMAYPIRVGSQDAIKPLYSQVNVESAMLEHQEMEHRGKRLFYIDYPEQRGDTPPTLGQWLDELARAQRRIGTPGLPFWREVPAQIFLRFKYLLERMGTIQPIVVDGRAISLRPYNPAQRAAEQQEIATATQFAQIMAQMFPEEWKAVVDGRETMTAFMEKMRVTGLIKLRDPQAVNNFVQQIAPLVVGRERPGAPTLAGGGAVPQGGAGAAGVPPR